MLIMVVAGGVKLMLPKAGDAGSGSGASAGQGGSASSGAGGGRANGRRGMISQVKLVSASPRIFTDSLDVLGVVKARQSVTLSAATTQLVSRVLFTPGQRVAKNQILVELKTLEQDAGLAQAKARAIVAERGYQRWKALADQGYASKAAVEQYEAVWLAAKADVDAAQARLGDRLIRAPFAGVVGLSDIAPGAVVNPGAAIVTLDDDSVLRVDFQIPDRFIASVHEGQEIEASVDAYSGLTIRGRITHLDTRIDERTRALTARSEFPGADRRVKPGMMLRIAVAQGEHQGLSVPETAVAVQGDGAYVFVALKQGQKMTADQRPIVTGVRQDGFVEVKDGLEPGDMLVADGLNKVQAGQAIRVGGKPGSGGASSGRKPGAGAARPAA